MTRIPSTSTVLAAHSMVCTIDQLATAAALDVLGAGGSAADAAIAANAVLTVTQQHHCGLGGDLWALVHAPGGQVAALNASGRAGSGADPDRLRGAGHETMPRRGDVAAAPVPGCVDGWLALHERFGELDLERVLRAAIDVAEKGFAASNQLAAAAEQVAEVAGNTDLRGVATGALVRRPGVARSLRSLVTAGREGFYGGEFGAALLELGAGEYTDSDLASPLADWVAPWSLEAWGHDVWTTPPNSQGYLNLGGAWIASGLDLPNDPSDPLFAHLLIEAARAAAFDRSRVLHEHADRETLLDPEMLDRRRAAIEPDRAVDWADRHRGGDTMYLCVVDRSGMGVSLIQSNAAGFGCHLTVGETGIFLHNRGIGFNLDPGHPAEYGPGRRPPHTLAPALVTAPDGSLRAVLGTMGGDAQPQVVLQMLARLLHVGERPGQILSAGRFALASPEPMSGFDTWTAGGAVRVRLEPHARHWGEGLRARGHAVEIATEPDLSGFGHAHLIDLRDGTLAGASDPRARAGAALGR